MARVDIECAGVGAMTLFQIPMTINMTVKSSWIYCTANSEFSDPGLYLVILTMIRRMVRLCVIDTACAAWVAIQLDRPRLLSPFTSDDDFSSTCLPRRLG